MSDPTQVSGLGDISSVTTQVEDQTQKDMDTLTNAQMTTSMDQMTKLAYDTEIATVAQKTLMNVESWFANMLNSAAEKIGSLR